MNPIDFRKLCWETSLELGQVDLTALASGSEIVIDDVRIRTYCVAGQSAFLLMAYLGDVAPDDRVSVCETLLAIQLAAWDQPMVRFGMHPLDESLVLCLHVALDENIDRVGLAGLVKSVAAQVVNWRNVHLAGKVSVPTSDPAKTHAMAPAADAVLHAL